MAELKEKDPASRPGMEDHSDAVPRCLFCGQPEQLVWVHGHGQCAHCGINAMPCCDGAACDGG